MHHCHKGHAWSEKGDAEKCCNPEWRRILLVGSDAKRSETPLVVEESTGAVYGRRWERVPPPV